MITPPYHPTTLPPTMISSSNWSVEKGRKFDFYPAGVKWCETMFGENKDTDGGGEDDWHCRAGQERGEFIIWHVLAQHLSSGVSSSSWYIHQKQLQMILTLVTGSCSSHSFMSQFGCIFVRPKAKSEQVQRERRAGAGPVLQSLQWQHRSSLLDTITHHIRIYQNIYIYTHNTQWKWGSEKYYYSKPTLRFALLA